MKNYLLLIVVFTSLFCSSFAQSKLEIHQLTSSCIVDQQGKVIINTGGQTTNLVSQNIFLRDSIHYSDFDTISSVYKLNKREFFSYDNGGLLMQKEQEVIGKNGVTWGKSQRNNYLYTGSQLFDETSLSWNRDSSAFINSFKNLYTYNVDNSLKSVLFQPWDADNKEWDYSTSDNIVYLPNGSVDLIVRQKWNKNLNRWDNSLRSKLSYSGVNVSEKVFQSWNTNTLEWDNVQKDVFTYSGNSIEVITYSITGTEWTNYLRKVVEIENEKVKSITEYEWYGSWKQSNKNTYVYNSNNLIEELTKQKWASNLGAFRNNQFEKSFYSQREIFDVHNASVIEVLIANPVSRNQEFAISGLSVDKTYQIELIDMNGKVVFATNYQPGQQIKFGSKVTQGFYVLHLTSGTNFNKLQKLIVTQ